MFRSSKDRVLIWSLRTAATLSALVLVLIVVLLVTESLPALKAIGLIRFFTDGSWHPAGLERPTFDLRPAFVGTILTAGGALVLAVPVGIFAAVFSRFYAPRIIGAGFRRIVELLAGIPSVVYGLWGLTVLVPLIAEIRLPGTSLFAGMVILAIMILPTITLLVDAAFENVSGDYLLASAALGMSRFGVIAGVVFPLTWHAMLTATLLSLARALGETMAVLMVCGNVPQFPESLFDPVRTLTANMALEMGYALGVHRSALFVSGLMLTVLVLGLVVIAERFSPERPHV